MRYIVGVATQSVLGQEFVTTVGSSGTHVDNKENIHHFLVVNNGEAVFHEAGPSFPVELFSFPSNDKLHRVGFNITDFLEESEFLVLAGSQERIRSAAAAPEF